MSLRFELKKSREGFCRRSRGKVFPCRWTEVRKGAGTKSAKSDTTNLEPRVSEAERIVREGV